MTIEKFQNIERISNMNLDKEDKAILYIQELTGMQEYEINAMSLKRYNAICRKINAAFQTKLQGMKYGKPHSYIKANGTRYRLNYEIKRPPFNTGRYVEVAHFQKDIIGNLHKIMASMAVPVRFSWKKLRFVPVPVTGWMHEQISEDMKQARFAHAYHAAVFFYAVFTNSMKVLQPYFLQEMKKTMPEKEAMQTLTSLQSTLDGFIMPKWYRTLKISL